MPVYALLFGGNSLESDISELTYRKVRKALKNHASYLSIRLDHFGCFFLEKNGKSFKGEFKKDKSGNYFKTKFKKHYFDVVLPLVHGKGVEDGTLGGYFDTLNIPCIYSGVVNSALMQDKLFFKQVAEANNIPQCKAYQLSYNEYMESCDAIPNILQKLDFPLIVKPNSLGSSIGVYRVNNYEELHKALDNSFLYDSLVLLEEAVTNLKEVNVALLGYEDNYIVSELETVSSKDEVLSFFDKYLQSKDKITRIIPSDIDEELKEEIINIAKIAFNAFRCFGVVRFDFLIDEKSRKVYLNEANTIPGSLAYYLFKPLGYDLLDLVMELYKCYLVKKRKEDRLFHNYKEGQKKQLMAKE